jgi:Tol biopolymer transport system component
MPQDLRDKLQATLGSAYTLEGELGGGGMSRVFVAEDNLLGRKIVVKLLPSDTAAGVSLERFKREIQVVARLQHPHIVPILTAGQIETTDGAGTALPFYTMPFVKGESLRSRLSRGGELSVNEAVHLLRDVAAALAYAHGEGVVHRDIKPDNVIVSGGVAVVTDFGVAKALDIAAAEGGAHQAGITSLGIALGTPAYMSPEQASADPHVDHRADIYSFGVLAYELLAGTSPFSGRTPPQILAAQVTERPEAIQKRRPNVPPALAALITRCLEKRAGDRPQTADELLTALDAIATTPSGGMTPTSERLSPIRRIGRARILFAVLAIGIVTLGWQWWSRMNAPKTLAVGTTTPIAVSPELEGQPAISPDAKLVAFVSSTAKGFRIFLRQVDGGRSTLLSGDLAGNHSNPAWSPDGSRISFVDDGAIYVIPGLTGGSPKRLIENGGSHAWSPDGKRIAFERAGSGIWVRELGSGSDRQIVAGAMLNSPSWSPDGRFIAYANGPRPDFTNVSAASIWTVRAQGGKSAIISDSTHVNLSPVWTPDGISILYISNRDNTRDVYQQRIGSGGNPVGTPARVTTSIGSYGIALSADGSRMAYDVVRNYSNIWSVPIAAGSSSITDARQLTREHEHVETMSVSHDGNWIAYDSDRGGNADIYKMRVDGSEPVQITSNPANDFGPEWSPNDQEIAFYSGRSGNRDIYVVTAEGNAEQQVTSGPDQDWFPSWSPDGNHLAFLRGPNASGTIYVVTRGPSLTWSAPRPIPLASIAFRTKWSPDGALIAYRGAPDSGVMLVPPTGGTSRVLIAPSRFHEQRLSAFTWGRDASILYVSSLSGDGTSTIWAVPLSGGAPKKLLTDNPGHRLVGGMFVTDGKRIFYKLGQWESDVYVMDFKK